jgi:excisionase family DNA binding protein
MQQLTPVLVTQADLAAYLKITKPTIIKLRKEGKLPFIRIGKLIRFDFDEVLRTIKNNKN